MLVADVDHTKVKNQPSPDQGIALPVMAKTSRRCA